MNPRPAGREELVERYRRVRRFSERLCEPLEPEDCVVQSMPDVSPIRWHLAHTTWFFETFVVARTRPDYRPYNAAYEYLFNSYYNLVGDQFPRPRRGLLSRPTVAEVFEYRQAIDDRMERWFVEADDAPRDQLAIVELGIQHEQQHQELMCTDLKHVFSCNPLLPVYRPGESDSTAPAAVTWCPGVEGVQWIGHPGPGFAFDNEGPRHRVYVDAYEIASRPVCCGEFLEFVDDNGYQRPEFWLSAGWDTRCAEGWEAPLYWFRRDGQWRQVTLAGARPVSPGEPVCHVSYFEADAYARWRGLRLPTEAEWELAAAECELAGNLLESERFHPARTECSATAPPHAMFGDVWEWTASAYQPYPGYRPADGALGEYNGKFMCNQHVLRGGSCVTPQSHLRTTYRNFFPPAARWQFTGIRLAR